jgi:hypothetical protein
MSDAEKDRLLSVYAGTIRDQDARLRDLEKDRDEFRKIVSTPKPAEVAADAAAKNKSFYERPYEATQELVRAEVQAAVAPLVDLVRGNANRSDYDRIKDSFRVDPRFKPVFDAGLEPHIDRMIQNHAAAGQPVTKEIVLVAISGVKGAADLGLLGDFGGNSGQPSMAGVPPAPNSSPSGPTMVTPPHLRPSAPPAPGGSGDDKPKLRDLTENEERLRRENRMTKEEFLAGMDMAAMDVVKQDKWPGEPPKRQPGGLR